MSSLIIFATIGALLFKTQFTPTVKEYLVSDATLYAQKLEASLHAIFNKIEAIQTLYTSVDLSHDNLDALLDHLVKNNSELEGLFVVDEQGQIIAQNDPLYPGRNPSLFLPYLDSRLSLKRSLTPVMNEFSLSSTDPYIVLNRRIFKSDQFAEIYAVINLHTFQEIVIPKGIFSSSFRIIYDRNNTIVASSDPNSTYWSLSDFNQRSNLFSTLSKTDKSEGFISLTFDQKKSTGYFVNVEGVNWRVLTLIPNKEFVQPLLNILPLALMLITIYVGVLLIVMLFISHYVDRPFQEMIKGINKIRNQGYNIRIPEIGSYEFQIISASFNRLIGQVSEDTKELKRLNWELDYLTTHVPGGLFACKFEADLPLLIISTSLANLLGYKDRNSFISENNNALIHALLVDQKSDFLQLLISNIGEDGVGMINIHPKKSLDVKWIAISYKIVDSIDDPSQKTLLGMAVDSTQMISSLEKLRRADERSQFILDQTDEVIFEWSLSEHRFIFLSRENNWMRMFGAPLAHDANLELGLLYMMNEQDQSRFISKIEELKRSGKQGIQIDVRLVKLFLSEEREIWTRFLLFPISNSNGEVERIVGRIKDINQEKMESIRLIGLSHSDSLTNLLNRRGFEASIERILSIADGELNRHLLVMFDIDNFKEVNDTHGHLYGDNILIQISSLLRQTFRSTDLLGRLGGDEFGLFLVNFHKISVLNQKIEYLLSLMKERGFTCSVGIASFPENGKTFTELYKEADTALYQVKQRGKNGYAFATLSQSLSGTEG